MGVSLSEADASIAAPFTYAKPDISCIPTLMKEGRASLVTSFQLFQYMAVYSMNQFSAVLMLYWYGSVFGDRQYLYQVNGDVMCVRRVQPSCQLAGCVLH